MEEMDVLPNTYYIANILIVKAKTDRDLTKIENFRPISLVNINTNILKNKSYITIRSFHPEDGSTIYIYNTYKFNIQ